MAEAVIDTVTPNAALEEVENEFMLRGSLALAYNNQRKYMFNFH